MKKTDDKILDMDDFLSFPTEEVNAIEFYQSFLLANKITAEIPKKLRPESPYQKYRFLKEIHSSTEERRTLFRKKTDASDVLIALWLSQVKENVFFQISENRLTKFNGLSKEEMKKFALLSADEKHLPHLQKTLAELGIVLIYQRAIPGMKLDGAVYTINGSNPVIALSLRHPRLDIFWFSLMHELAHICLHYEKLSEPILDNFDNQSEELTELQADRLAADTFISRAEWRSCGALFDQKEQSVLQYAKRLGIHPAIVAGRIRKEVGKHTIFSNIVNSVNVRKIFFDEN